MNPSAPLLVTVTFLTFDHMNSSFTVYSILLWWSVIAAVHSICCTLEILVRFWPHFLGSRCRRCVCEGQQNRIPGLVFEWSADNFISAMEWKHHCAHVCACECVWIVSRSISIDLAPDIDRCLQEAASQPHGTLDHVGQIYEQASYTVHWWH